MMACYLTGRDYLIFRCLSSGPTSLPYVVDFLNEKIGAKDPSAVVRNRASAMSTHVVWKRLSKLAKDEWVQARRYADSIKGKAQMLYALTPKAASVLSEVEKVKLENIRCYLPSDRMVSHELEVTELVRTLKKDAMVICAEVFITDEQTLRGTKGMELKSRMGRKRLEDVFPDLHVVFTYREEKVALKKEFAMEMDNATIPENKVAAKLEKVLRVWGWFPLVVCTVQSRVDKISRAVMDRGGPQLGGNVCFGLFSDYCRLGLLRTQWNLATGRSAVLVKTK